MYTGARALLNLLLSTRYDPGRASVLEGRSLTLPDLGKACIRVHGRARPAQGRSEAKYGMISLSLQNPGVNHFLYRIIRLTSHFGCGHLEMAFVDSGEGMEIYAIRNILKSNISRVHLERFFGSLKNFRDRDELRALIGVISELESLGIDCRLAHPSKCCRLAVSPVLLNSGTRDIALATLHRKYERLSKKLGYPSCDSRKPDEAHAKVPR